MKRTISVLISICLILLVLPGCSSAKKGQPTMPWQEKTEAGSEEPDQTSPVSGKPEATTPGEETSGQNDLSSLTDLPTIPAEGYSRYLTMKSNAYDRINAKIEEYEELSFTVGMALLPVIMVDLSFILVSVLGIEGGEAALRMMTADDVVIEKNGQVYSITYTDEEGGKFIQTAEFFSDQDAIKSTVATDGKETAIFEYTKVGNGYASHYYSANEESDDYTLITTFFDESNISAFGVTTVSDAPESIIGKPDLTAEYVVNDEMYIILEDGTLTVMIDGELNTY